MKRYQYLILLILLIHTFMLAWIGYRKSPTWDEVAHLPAGLFVWKTGRYNLYSVNPPLTRSVAAIPVYLVPHEESWKSYSNVPTERREFGIGNEFVRVNGERIFWLYTLARWACIPFSLLAGWICYLWAKELYGVTAGLVALVVWCFSPLVLGHASLITPDSSSAAFGVMACYFFWHWLKKPSWSSTWWAGFTLGLAECTKFTFIIWYAFWPFVWLVCFFLSRREPEQTPFIKQALRLFVILFLSVVVTNWFYMFDGTFNQLKSYRFVSKTFGNIHGNFTKASLDWVPVPFPVDYVYGIDVQKLDFERKMHSYLRGEWKHGGWYHYYAYAYLVKEPLGILLLILLATFAGLFLKGYASTYRNEFVICFFPLSLLIFVSSQTGFNHHLRYMLPALPFVYIYLSKTAKSFFMAKQKIVATLTGVGLAWLVAGSVYYYPHSISYFNELVGGPKNGHYHLGNSNIDWGQDLLYLKRWLERHPEVKLDGLLYDMPLVDVSLAGITDPKNKPVVPQEGWYAVSVNQIHNINRNYEYFLQLEPYDRIGYSINIYYLSPEDARRVRINLGIMDVDPNDYPEVIEEERPVLTEETQKTKE